MTDEVPILPPQEALEFFRRKGLQRGFAWQDVWQQEHVRAFTVAKAMSYDVLEDIRGAVDRAIAEGETLEQFRQQLRPRLEARGWWGRKSMIDPADGVAKDVQLGSPRRLKTIFQVNMRMAYQAGRWERMERNKAAFPYVRYVSVGDARVRPQHRDWHGVIRPIDDEWWDTHYPPCGWNCRCTAVPVSARMMERRGWEVTDKPPRFLPERYVNPRTGEVTKIEAGITPGFNYNVGKAYLDDLAARPIGDLEPMGEAESQEVARAFMEPLGLAGDQARAGAVFVDKSGTPLAITPGWFRSPDGAGASPGDPSQAAIAGRTIADPDEIRLRWEEDAAGKARLFRRYIAAQEAGLVVVDVGKTGWRFAALDSAADAIGDSEPVWERLVDRATSRAIGALVLRSLARPGEHHDLPLDVAGPPSPPAVHGFSRSIQSSNVVHSIVSHGDAQREFARDQLPIRNADFELIPAIIRLADKVTPHGSKRGGKGQSISYEATIGGIRYVYVERVGTQKRQLTFKTLWKRRSQR